MLVFTGEYVDAGWYVLCAVWGAVAAFLVARPIRTQRPATALGVHCLQKKIR